MDNIISTIKQEIGITLDRLLDAKHNIVDIGVHSTKDITPTGSYVVGFFDITGTVNSTMLFLLPTEMAITLVNMMGAEPDYTKDSVNEEDLDIVMEVITDMFDTTSSTLRSTSCIPTLKFELVDTTILPTIDKTTILDFDKIFNFGVSIGGTDGQISLVVQQNILDSLNTTTNVQMINQSTPTKQYTDDIRVGVKVVVGTFEVTIGELSSLVAGNLFKLDTLVNEPLYIYVGGTCFAKGDVVGVDGNFGIQVTEVLGEVNG
jgi:flagellar motor switch protein FliN/FliY